MNRLETRRLILRPFTAEDASDVYSYASDPQVGPPAGWPPHQSVEESLEIINTVFQAPHCYAVVWRESGKVIGSVGFVGSHHAQLSGPDEEIGYALSPEFWGQGIMPEAVVALLRFGFEELELATIWCVHDEFNHKSRRVVEKSGFQYQYTNEGYVVLMEEQRTHLHYAMSREIWEERQADEELLGMLFSLTT